MNLKDLENLPIKIPNHKELCICREPYGWWIGYEGKTLEDEVSAYGKTLEKAVEKLIKWYPDYFK